MAKIKTYTAATSIGSTDEFFGTDSSDSNKSKGFLVGDVADFIGSGVTRDIEQDAGLYVFDDTSAGFNISNTNFSQVLAMTLSPAGLSPPDMTVTAQAKAKYLGTTAKLFQVTLSTNLIINSGSPLFLRSRVYVNDVYQPNTESVAAISGLNNSAMSASFPIVLNEGDYFDWRFAVDTGNVGLTNSWTNIYGVSSFSTV